MIIDINACLGHYPFRQLRFNSAPELVGLMDRNGIDRALVSSLHAVFYRDAHRGNEELHAAARAHARRIIPVATVNPRYVGWERDLSEAVKQWGMRVVTLVPSHHGYRLGDERGRAALARIAELGVPVLLMQRYEDRRQRHHFDPAEDLTAAELIEVAQAYPTLRFILPNWIGLDGAALARAGLKDRCLIDFARIQVVYSRDVQKLIDTLGVNAVAFGSHMPFDYVAPSLIKLENLRMLRPADHEAVAWRNAARFLQLD